jgi:arginine/ornithine N-succinyltransferase beta subunit
MTSPVDDLIIRPVRLEDAEALWIIARQQGVIETTLALPSLRLEQRVKSLRRSPPLFLKQQQESAQRDQHFLYVFQA